jgi:hypothetical protein
MAVNSVALTSLNGNNGHALPRSRRAFLKAAPARIGLLEDQVEGLEICLETIAKALASKADGPLTVALETRLNNLVEAVVKLAEVVRLVDGRSRRTRRHAMHIADQLAF